MKNERNRRTKEEKNNNEIKMVSITTSRTTKDVRICVDPIFITVLVYLKIAIIMYSFTFFWYLFRQKRGENARKKYDVAKFRSNLHWLGYVLIQDIVNLLSSIKSVTIINYLRFSGGTSSVLLFLYKNSNRHLTLFILVSFGVYLQFSVDFFIFL